MAHFPEAEDGSSAGPSFRASANRFGMALPGYGPVRAESIPVAGPSTPLHQAIRDEAEQGPAAGIRKGQSSTTPGTVVFSASERTTLPAVASLGEDPSGSNAKGPTSASDATAGLHATPPLTPQTVGRELKSGQNQPGVHERRPRPYEGAWVERAQEIVKDIKNSEGINQLVEFLLTTRYQRILKGNMPLLIPDRILETDALQNITRRGLVTPNLLPSAMMHETLSVYGGTTENVGVRLIPPSEVPIGGRGMRLPSGLIDPKTVTAFAATADLVGRDGKAEGTANYSYALYLNPYGLNLHGQLRSTVKDLITQAQPWYPSEDVRDKKLLWLDCNLLNYNEVVGILKRREAQHEEDVARGTSLEAYNRTHPWLGGLPGSGKDA